MLLIMQQIGFGFLWLQWMRAIFSTDVKQDSWKKHFIVSMGSGKEIYSPCTFILATDLHFLLNKAENLRVMKLSMA